jgi:hypothetical protein
VLCLETLLLEDSHADIGARLKEAIAYYLARSSDSRQRCRKAVEDLYECRSSYIHTGMMDATYGERESWRNLCARVLCKEMYTLDELRQEDEDASF